MESQLINQLNILVGCYKIVRHVDDLKDVLKFGEGSHLVVAQGRVHENDQSRPIFYLVLNFDLLHAKSGLIVFAHGFGKLVARANPQHFQVAMVLVGKLSNYFFYF